MTKPVAIIGAFDDLRSRDVRLLQEAAKLGPVTVILYPDQLVRSETGRAPKFPLAERLYLLRAIRFVASVIPLSGSISPGALPKIQDFSPALWADLESDLNERRRDFCRNHGLDYRVFSAAQLAGFPEHLPAAAPALQKKVVVTGCYDWLHSGHVRFFEEVSHYGDLYVIVGHDANIRLLKGLGHPLIPEQERRYMAGSIRYVTQALVSSGEGWLDADPQIQQIRPQIYAVNEDGDKGGKREYCAGMGIEYLVLQRIPAPGLPERSSTNLRGF
jgi:cytidyltransferase-like protein